MQALTTAALLFSFLALSTSSPAQTSTIEKITPPAQLKPITVLAQGRVQLGSDGMYTFQWPGPYFTADYTGSDLYFKVGAGRQHLRIIVDGAAPASLLTDGTPATYSIATHEHGKHHVRIDAVNENQDSPKSLGAFSVSAAAPKQPAVDLPLLRQIEFIGDSHTVGYGNTSKTGTCTQDEVWSTTDTSQSLGADIARHYSADYQLIAISGRGVVRNWNGTPNPLLPEAYPYTLLISKNGSQSGDMNLSGVTRQFYTNRTWNPSVLVVALGTNDYSTDLHAGEPWKTRDDLHADFEAKYAAFLRSLRSAHPHALIVVWATDMVHEEIATEARKVVDTLRTAGDAHLDFIEMTGLAFSGCHGHPSVADDQTVANEIIADIDAHKHVWLTAHAGS